MSAKPDQLLKPLVDIEKSLFDVLVTKPATSLGAVAPPRVPGPAEIASNIFSGVGPQLPGMKEVKTVIESGATIKSASRGFS